MAVLALHNLAVQWLLPASAGWALNLATAAGLSTFARHAGCSRADLGIGVEDAGRGLRVGIAAAAVAGGGVALGAALPATQRFFGDRRVSDVGRGEVAYQLTLRIPRATALAEEVLFRGILLTLFRRRRSPAAAVLWTSLLFGAWHVLPTIDHYHGNPASDLVADPNRGRRLAVLATTCPRLGPVACSRGRGCGRAVCSRRSWPRGCQCLGLPGGTTGGEPPALLGRQAGWPARDSSPEGVDGSPSRRAGCSCDRTALGGIVMRRLATVFGGIRWSDQAIRLARWQNPVVASPAAPLETVAALDALGPSLMPRTSRLQGVSMGLSVLGARATTGVVERLTRLVVPAEAPLARRLAARAVVGGAGAALAALPQRQGERLWTASLRSTGLLLRAGAAGGAVHDLGHGLQERYPAQRAIRPVAVSAALTGGLLWWGGRRLAAREAAVARWPLPQTSTLPAALASSYMVTAAGTGLARGYVLTRDLLESYFGPGPTKRLVARLVNAGAWAAAATGAYNAGVAYVGRANEKVEPGYATPPGSPLLSGSEQSLLPFADLGQQGRRFVTDVVTPELIKEVMGEEAVAQPIRTYVGFNSEPLYPTGRAELALAELARTGAFDRSYLLLVSPTGTGWVDHTMIEAAEFLARGDIATCCVQYGRYPSFLSVQKVALGQSQFRLLLWGVKQRLEERPPERRPRVLVFGESLGAWTSSDVVMFQGIEGFDHYGIDRALWVGLPWLAKWSRSGMTRGSTTLVPAGTVEVFDRHEQLAALSEEQRARLRAVILSHDNDPIAVMGPELIVQRPAWLADSQRGRGVPEQMRWIPLVTFVQTAMDAANAMVSVPGDFGSFGHDYRADMVRFVHDAYGFPRASDAQLDRIEQQLRSLELERSQRIKAEHAHAAPQPPTHRAAGADAAAGVPLRTRRTRGARWLRGRGQEQPPSTPKE